MILSSLVVLLLAAFSELVLLWDSAQNAAPASLVPNWFGQPVRFSTLIISAVTALAAVLLAIFALAGIFDEKVFLSDTWATIIFVPFGLVLLGAGFSGKGFLPRVNEQSVMVTVFLLALNSVSNGLTTHPAELVGLVICPCVLILFLLMKRAALNNTAKALVYLAYLAAVVALGYQSQAIGLFEIPDLNLSEAAIVGSFTVFLILHILFFLRFFLICSSLILPPNRPYIDAVMPYHFNDEQVSPMRFVFFGLAVGAVLGLNAWLGLFSTQALTNMAVMLAVQFFFKGQSG